METIEYKGHYINITYCRTEDKYIASVWFWEDMFFTEEIEDYETVLSQAKLEIDNNLAN